MLNQEGFLIKLADHVVVVERLTTVVVFRVILVDEWVLNAVPLIVYDLIFY